MKRSIHLSLRWISTLAILILVLSACAPAATTVPTDTAVAPSDTPAVIDTAMVTDTPIPSDTPAATIAPTTADTIAPTTGATLAATTAATEAIPVTGATAMPASTPSGPATVNMASDATLGPILVDGMGMTLYIYSNDTPGVSTCTGNCAKAWPPLLTNGAPIAGTGVDASKLGTISLADGSTMVTYNNKPLYYFAKDTKAGDTTGNGVAGVWYIIAP